MPFNKVYWFSPRTYSFGWGPPATWQGWLAQILYGVFFAVGLDFLRNHNFGWPIRAGFGVLMLVGFFPFAYWTGEPPALIRRESSK